MIETVLAECRRLVPRDEWVSSIFKGSFQIENGSIELPFLVEGQYFRLIGSLMNDGVYQYPCNQLIDETFEGVIWAMRLPQSFLSDCEKIATWIEKNDGSNGIQSESFGGYSYTKRTSSTGGAWTWKDEFAEVLKNYRKAGTNVWR